MPRKMIVAISLFLGLFLISCAPVPTRIGGRTTPKVDPNYTPKKIYPVDYNKGWESTLKGLKENRIPIGSVNKEVGLIKTDYQPGPEVMFLTTLYWTRYKYNINISKEAENKTRIDIRCTYEVKKEKDSYTDSTASSPETVKALEQELYIKVEPYISQ